MAWRNLVREGDEDVTEWVGVLLRVSLEAPELEDVGDAGTLLNRRIVQRPAYAKVSFVSSQARGNRLPVLSTSVELCARDPRLDTFFGSNGVEVPTPT